MQVFYVGLEYQPHEDAGIEVSSEIPEPSYYFFHDRKLVGPFETEIEAAANLKERTQ